MKRNNNYIYPKTIREMIDGKRHYEINGNEKLPSVTTIWSATQPAEKSESLKAWRARIGEDSATRIVDESAARGTAMHKILEKYILEEGYLDLTNVGKDAHNMAMQVIQQGLCNVTEFYGSECTLYYPGLYAGQTDLIARSDHGEEYIFVDYFTNHDLPSIQTENGLVFNGSLINTLAGPIAPGQYAQASGEGVLSIGEVSSLSGTAKAIRLDGNEFVLSDGDPVFQGDTIEVSGSGAVGLTFLDKTTLSLSEGGKMVLDELVYDRRVVGESRDSDNDVELIA